MTLANANLQKLQGNYLTLKRFACIEVTIYI